MNKNFKLLVALTGLLLPTTGIAEKLMPKTHFQVIGNHSTNNTYKLGERPFWEKVIPEKSNGQITADLTPLEASGLKGPELLRLMKVGSLQFGTGVLGYMAGDSPEFMAVDLPGFSSNFQETRRYSELFRPMWEEITEKDYNTKLLALFPSPPQVFWCKPEINGLDDLKGLKIRVSTPAMASMVSKFGGSTVNTPFPEVPTALERGVIDCAITGTLAGNLALWHEVSEYLYPMAMGWSLQFIAVNSDFWNSLDPQVRQFMAAEYKELEDRLWDIMDADVKQGIDCNIGADSCTLGNKADMKLVEVTAEDLARQAEILNNIIIPDWLEKCSDECKRLFASIER
ncbi:MAG: TRAP transporter substrate-binding protein [Rhodospirillales bacterium]|nr:TRAP transporter substrate-binding protein [Rhodospirillales bacterium]|tara:strand:- start:5629 stop:6654 length:1026 start_codon:yes stop_codon:yes gene_type:complete